MALAAFFLLLSAMWGRNEPRKSSTCKGEANVLHRHTCFYHSSLEMLTPFYVHVGKQLTRVAFNHLPSWSPMSSKQKTSYDWRPYASFALE